MKPVFRRNQSNWRLEQMPTNLKKNNKITFAIKLVSNKKFGVFFSFENGGGCNFIFQIMKWMDRLSELVDSRTFLTQTRFN